MNPRQRLETALNHQEPDRVPVDLGGIVTGITTRANRNLKAFLGLDGEEEVVDRVQQLARPTEDLLVRLGVDTRYLYLKASRDWQDIELPEDTYQDEFGVRRKAAMGPDERPLYYDFFGGDAAHPLSGVETVADLVKYPWPDPHDPARYAGLEEAARQLYQTTGYAVMVNLIASLFEFSWYLRGLVNFFQDLKLQPKLAGALLDAMLEYQVALVGEVLDRVGPYVSVINTGSDLGTQRAPMISPDLYREIIWPRYCKLWAFIKTKAEAKIFYHTCGSVIPMLPYLVEGGVDAVHPVQPAAAGMGDRLRLKREFGGQITFWGGFDQQRVLPFGTPAEVREATKRLLDEFMPGGGFVFAAGHNIQADVPPENIVALFDTVSEFGVY